MIANLVVAMLVSVPLLSGLVVAMRWPDQQRGYYELLSQLIATLFIAIVLEIFGRDARTWNDRADRTLVLSLIVISWTGLFACVRVLLEGDDTWWTLGFGTAGLVSSSMLVSLTLLSRLLTSGANSQAIVVIFLLPPLILLSIV